MLLRVPERSLSETAKEEAVIIAVERVCRNYAYFNVRRGKPYRPVVKQRVSENYTCGRFKKKQT